MAGAPGSKVLALAVVLAACVGVIAWRLAEAKLRAEETEQIDRASKAIAPAAGELSSPSGAVQARTPAEDPRPAPAAPSTGESSSSLVRLSGTVKDRGGSPAPDSGVVDLTDSRGTRRWFEIVAGGYRFEGLAPGDYVLGVDEWGRKRVERSITLLPTDVDRHEDFVLDPVWTLTVRLVTPDRVPLRDALRKQSIAPGFGLSVLAGTQPPGDRLPPSYLWTRSAEGIARSSGGEKTDVRLAIDGEPPVYVYVAMRDVVLVSRRVEERVPEITFTIDLDYLRSLLGGVTLVLLENGTDAPARQAWLHLVTVQSTESAVQPAEDGRVTFGGRVPGLYGISVFGAGRVCQTFRATIEPGRTTDLGKLRLAHGVEIRGRCVDAGGQGQPVLPVLQKIGDALDTQVLFVGEKPEDGEGFLFKNFEAGRYLVKVSSEQQPDPPWSIVPTILDTREGPLEHVVLVVHHPVPLVLRPVSAGVDGMSYRVLTLDEVLCGEGILVGARAERLSLSPGKYVLRLSRGESPVREETFEIGEDTLTLAIEP